MFPVERFLISVSSFDPFELFDRSEVKVLMIIANAEFLALSLCYEIFITISIESLH